MTPCVVTVTAATREEARRIASALLDRKLAACVQILPGVESHYVWQGKREHAGEVLLLIKATRENFSALEQCVKANHSYECPEIVALEVAEVSADYRAWWLG
jgi:periplasmic divalent cation tolerance protein